MLRLCHNNKIYKPGGRYSFCTSRRGGFSRRWRTRNAGGLPLWCNPCGNLAVLSTAPNPCRNLAVLVLRTLRVIAICARPSETLETLEKTVLLCEPSPAATRTATVRFSAARCAVALPGSLRGLWAVLVMYPVLAASNTQQHVGVVGLVWQGPEQHSHPSRLHSSGRCPQF